MKTDNELIAEFMGIAVRPGPGVLYPCDEDGMIDYKNVEPYWPDKDWNQLMPAVDKINKSPFDDIRGIELIETIHRYLKKVQIADAHMYVAEFIRWHNETHKQNESTI